MVNVFQLYKTQDSIREFEFMLKRTLIGGTLLAASGILFAWPGNAQIAQQIIRESLGSKEKVRRLNQHELDQLLQGIPGTPRSNRQKQYNTELGQRLADYARQHVSGTRWNCYAYVASAIHAQTEPFLEGMHAYEAADQLATSPYFKEIQVSTEELKTLPVGAVVVWGKGKARSGHISIADGNGNEISDHIAPQMLAHYGGAGQRTFLPVDPKDPVYLDSEEF